MKQLLPPLALACVLTGPALAQDKVYRCGPDGRSYSATPCADGREVPVADPRSADQRRQARETAEREADLAQQLRHERKLRERARPAGAARLGPPQAAEPAASKPPARQKAKKGRKGAALGDAEADPVMSEPVRAPAPRSR